LHASSFGTQRGAGKVGYAGYIHSAVFEVEPSAFSPVPSSPFAYWASERVRGAFTRNPRFDVGQRAARDA
jgi:hypothetical protein